MRYLGWLSAIVVALLGAGVAAHLAGDVYSAELWYDHSLNATAAKSLATGHGYATFRYGVAKPFDPIVTTGPTLIVPAALAIWFFGNRYWAPGLASAVLNGVLITLVCLSARRLWPGCGRGLAFAAVLLAAVPLCLYGIYYYTLYGEAVCAWFTLLGVLRYYREPRRLRTAVQAACWFGAAYVTKSLSALALVAVGLAAMLSWLAGCERAGRGAVRLAVMIGVYAALCVGYQAARDGYVRHYGYALETHRAEERAMFIDHGSGIGPLQRAWVQRAAEPGAVARHVRALATANAKILRSEHTPVEMALALALWAGVMGGSWSVLRRRGRAGPTPTADDAALTAGALCAAALALYFAVTLAWYLLIYSEGWYRHVYMGVVSMVAAVALWVTLPRAGRAVGAWAAMLLLAVALAVVRGPHGREFVRSTRAARSPVLEAQLQTAAFVDRTASNAVFLAAGWWANPEIEYLAADPRFRFQDYYQVRDTLDAAAVPVYLLRGLAWNWGGDPVLTALQARGDREVVFRAEPYVVALLATPAAATANAQALPALPVVAGEVVEPAR
jgi:hypothetical protein